jgi:hypothetical protein
MLRPGKALGSANTFSIQGFQRSDRDAKKQAKYAGYFLT